MANSTPLSQWLRQAPAEDARLSFAAAAAAVAGVLGALTGLIVTAGVAEVSLAGESSLRAAILPLTVIMVAAIGLIGYGALFSGRLELSAIERQALQERGGALNWIGRISFGMTMGLLAYLALLLAFAYLDLVFTGTTIFRFSAVVAAAIGCAAVAGLAAYWVAGLTHRAILPITSLLVNLGLLVSMLLVQNPRWWTESLSYMGDHPDSWTVFNLTMLLTGLNVWAAGAHLTRILALLAARGAFPRRTPILMGAGLGIIGAGIMFVGLFPWSFSQLYGLLHDIGSHTMLLTLAVLMLALRWVAPGFPRLFHILSLLMGLVVAGGVALFVLKAVSFVLFELVVFVMIVPWLLLLQRYVTRAAD
jgi:hypothetical protein